MPSKQVTDRQKNARAVLAALSTHESAIAHELGGQLSAHLSRGESLPDLALVLSLMGRSLAQATDALVAADAAHEAELRDDAEPRAARDEVADQLRSELIDLRATVLGLYGTAGATALALQGETPRDAVVLSRFAADVLRACTTPAVLPSPKVRGTKLDLKELASVLSPLCKSLEAHLSTVAREEREAQVTLSKKNAAQDHFDRTFSATAALLSALLLSAGQADLAARVRPSPRRGGISDPEPTPPGDPLPTPPTH